MSTTNAEEGKAQASSDQNQPGGANGNDDGAVLKEEHKQNEPEPAATGDKATPQKEEEGKRASPGDHLKVSAARQNPNVDERDDFDYEEAYKSWSEYRISGKAPTRRGYHASFVHDNYLYIHGGHDIREGTLDDMHKINLDPKGNDNQWEQINQRGVIQPGCIGYHSLTCHGDKAFLFGGSNLGKDNEKMYEFDINSHEWKVVKPKGDCPKTRDEHSADLWNDTIVIFGGNVQGFKTNEVWFYHINENSWEKVEAEDCPPERSIHGHAVLDDTLYVFGGKDLDNNKLNDLWAFDLNSRKWKKCPMEGDAPIERSGASLVGYNGYLVLFGGIFELTKELGDCYAYDIKSGNWYTLFEEIDSPVHRHSPNHTFGMGKFGRQDSIKSPSPFHKSKNDPNFSMNLKKTKTNKKKNLNHSIFEVDNSMIRKQRQLKLLKKKRENEKNPLEDSMLTSPTSLSMKNSFLIKNSNKGFDNYFATQKRRKMGASMSPDITNLSPSKAPRNSKVAGVRPRPRDGHSAVCWGDYMVIFGGDRHHMPFNDLFSLNIKQEINK